MISWKETRARLKEDCIRLWQDFEIDPTTRPNILWTHPSFQCVFLHRLSHLFFSRNHRLIGRFIWHLNLMLTGADISPISDIGGGLVIRKPEKVIILGRIGKNCKIFGQGGIGGGRATKNIGVGPGLPVIKDNVEVGFGAVILGPIEIGNDVIIGSRALVVKDVPEKMFVEVSQKFQDEPRSRELNPESYEEKEKETFWGQIEKDIEQYLHYSSDFIEKNISFRRKVSAFFTPSLLCNFFYRMSHRCYRPGLKWLARIFYTINFVLHRIHIAPESRIAGGLYIPHTSGVVFCGHAGKNLVLYANSTVGSQNIHADNNRVCQDAPVLGDDVIVGAYSVIAGGIKVGDRSLIGVNSFICESIEPDTVVMSRERIKLKKTQERDYVEPRQD